MLLGAALGGNLRAISVLVSVLGRSPSESGDADADDLTDRDLEIIKGLEEREREGSDQLPGSSKERQE